MPPQQASEEYEHKAEHSAQLPLHYRLKFCRPRRGKKLLMNGLSPTRSSNIWAEHLELLCCMSWDVAANTANAMPPKSLIKGHMDGLIGKYSPTY